MGKLIGFYSLTCSECTAFIATQKDDDAERERVAKNWTKKYNHQFNQYCQNLKTSSRDS
jgi:hypothetical protein